MEYQIKEQSQALLKTQPNSISEIEDEYEEMEQLIAQGEGASENADKSGG